LWRLRRGFDSRTWTFLFGVLMWKNVQFLSAWCGLASRGRCVL